MPIPAHALLLGSPGGSAAVPALVQRSYGLNVHTPPALGAVPTAGNLLVARVGGRGGTATTAPTGWTKIVSTWSPGGSVMYYRVADGSETTTPFTDNEAVSGNWGVVVDEWSGMHASPLDVWANGASGGSTVSCGTTGTSSSGNLLVVAVAGIRNGYAWVSWSDSLIDNGNAIQFGSGHKITSGAATWTATATFASTTGTAGGIIAVFKGA